MLGIVGYEGRTVGMLGLYLVLFLGLLMRYLPICRYASHDLRYVNRSVLGDDSESAACDWVAYLSRYSDLAAKGILTAAQARQHYEIEGRAQGRQCSTDFKLMGLDQFRSRNSSCYNAIDFQALSTLPLPPLDTSKSSSQLRLVNIGSGTTGTRFLFKVICDELQIRGLHWWSACTLLDDAYNPLAFWWEYIRHCTIMKAQPAAQYACKTSFALKMLDYEVKRLINEVEVLSDSPIDVIYAEYASYMNQALTIFTLRDPRVWAVKRLTQHPGHTIMCKPEVVAMGKARHAFDIPACLKSTEYIHEALVDETSTKRIAQGYVEMSTYNARVARNLHIMCLWDESAELARIELAAVWKLYTSP